MSSRRLERVRELLKREIGIAILQEVPVEEAGVITVNELHLSRDLHAARVFISAVGAKDKSDNAITILRRKRARIQAKVASSVVLKYTPHLHFIMDDSIRRGDQVLSIIEELDQSDSSS